MINKFADGGAEQRHKNQPPQTGKDTDECADEGAQNTEFGCSGLLCAEGLSDSVDNQSDNR